MRNHPASKVSANPSPISATRLPGPSLMALACALAMAGAAQAQTPPAQLLETQQGGAKLAGADGPATQGQVRVIVQFTEEPVVGMRPGVRVTTANRAEMAQHSQKLKQAKAPRLSAIARLGGRVQNTTEYAYNGAVVDIAAERVPALRSLPGVKSVEPAGVFEMSAVPPSVAELIGTHAVNQGGNAGQGVAIAIIDSGVDYTHASFEGPGTVAYYQAAVAGTGPTTIGDTPGVFPDGPRVKGGYDWLGDTWSNSAATPGGMTVTPDPDPIDNKQLASDAAGHGTQSASAAAGSAVPASLIRAGSAPGATILAYRGCSRLSTSCEGSALLNSIESVIQYAAGNPNGGQPGANNPALPAGTRFVINMSLGSSYGIPATNPLAEAARNAVRAGVTVVASAGNANNIPLIVGTPSAADTLISVAASQPALLTGPSLAIGAPLNQSYTIIPGSFGAPFAAAVTLPLGFGGPNAAAGSNTNLACSNPIGQANPGPADPPIPALGGAIGIADRGTCEFSEKAVNVQRAGGAASIIVNNVAGAGAFGMAAGAAAALVTTPSYAIGTEDGIAVKNALAANPGLTGTISPLGDLPNITGGIDLTDLISDFSSRGPSQHGLSLKPDITAPGTNIFMADVGTGNAGNNNSGTSFSSPLAAGVAALVLSARPTLEPWQVKAAMMNTAETTVYATKTAGGTTLAGLTRMGAGRVQADRAVATGTLAYDAEDVDPTGTSYYNTAVSFGPQAFTAAGQASVSRTIVVQNLTGSTKTYNISVTPRFADDLARGMVFSASTPVIAVAPNSTATFQVTGTATGSQLPTSGGLPLRLMNVDTCTTTTNPPAPVAACTNKFDELEQDGFVTIDGGPNDTVRVPYLMVPRQASNVGVQRVGSAVVTTNTGVANTFVDVFNLVGAPDPQDQPALVPGSDVMPVDLRAVGIRYLPGAIPPPLPAGVTSGDVLQFAISLWNVIDSPRTAVLNVDIDTTGNGQPDFSVRNLNTTANRGAAFIVPTGSAPGGAFFFTDQPLSSKRLIMNVFPSLMGITPNSRIGIRVTSSNFNGGPVLDTLPNSGAFQYVKLNELVNFPGSRSYASASGSAQLFNFKTSAANTAASPGDKGLLMLLGENPVDSETAVLQLVP